MVYREKINYAKGVYSRNSRRVVNPRAWYQVDEKIRDVFVDTLYQGKQPVWGVFMGVKACLPPATNPTVLRLALASSEQLDLALALAHDTVNPHAAPTLSESHHHWCRRLSKALPPAMLSPEADPLQLLLSWLDPPIWQRLRLRFPRQRTYEVEKKSICLENTSNRLSTLWQAVVWRVTSLPSDSIPPGSHG